MDQVPDARRGQWRWDGQRYVTTDGRWWWDGRQWQPMPAQHRQMPPGAPGQQRTNPHRVVVQPRKPMTKGAKVALGVIASVCVLFLIIAVAAQAGNGGQQQSEKKAAATEATPTPTPTAKATPEPTPRPATPEPTPKPPTPPPAPVVDAMGNGSGETGPFDTNGHFKVTYSFDCSGMYGGSGNFIVTPVDANGNSLAGPEVNRLAANGNGTADGYTFGSQKQMHLQIVSECSWHVTVTTA